MSKANKSAGDEREMRGQEQVKVQEYFALREAHQTYFKISTIFKGARIHKQI